ncbi:MAG TPA: hypothetical protein VJI52_04655 [Candidatus Nanoarchaeia archaeon]|nr:hypothetical protein [Candidatus Nanoarchaeia archaeon]
MDFAIGMLLFTFTLVVYFSYTNNFQNEDKGSLDLMLKDAKSISSSLVLEGYPGDWSNLTAIRVGIADGQKVNATKLKRLNQLNYATGKKKFATSYDYFIYFVNGNGEVLNINGVCGSGYPLINLTYNIKSAYYYQDSDDSFMLDFMNQTFKADIYDDDISGLSSNLSKYDFLVMEHPLLSASEFNNNKAKLENYSSRGGILMVSGELAAPATNAMAGGDFKKKSGQSQSQRTAIVNSTDPAISLNVGDSMAFSQYYYVQNNSEAANLVRIATFNQTDDNAIAKWKYGNGTVYFFSDFDVSSFNGNFLDVVQNAAQSMIEGTCSSVNITGISAKDIVKTERYLTYNSKIIKMIVYVWQ